MNDWIEFVNTAILNYVKTPLFILTAVFAVITVTAIVLAVHEIRNDPQ